jgi:hypothetical protein
LGVTVAVNVTVCAAPLTFVNAGLVLPALKEVVVDWAAVVVNVMDHDPRFPDAAGELTWLAM